MTGPEPDPPARREWLAAAAFAALVALCVAPWPRPTLQLDTACALEPAGRAAASCDLSTLRGRRGLEWAGQSVRVYEDRLPLRDVRSRGEVRRNAPGAYFTDGFVLTFSSIDGTDPRANGRRYELRSEWGKDALAFGGSGWRSYALAALALALGALCVRWRARRGAFLLAAAISVSLACLAIQVVAVLREAPVHVDAGSSLPSAEAVAAGAIPYVTIEFNYTPLGLYELAFWSRAWPGTEAPAYAWYLGLVLLNEAACALLVYLMAVRLGARRALAAAAALSYLSMTLWFDGSRILFEPLFLVPVLVAAWLALAPASSGRLVLAGAVAAVALLVKQYGGFALFGLLGTALLDGAGRLRRASLIGVGFVGSLVALGLLLAGAGVDLLQLASQTSGSSYERRYEAVWLKLFLWQCTPALLALAVPFLPGAWAQRGVRLLACFGLASCLPLYFRQHQYYFLSLCPWIFALVAVGAEIAARGGRPLLRRLAIPAAALLLASVPLRAARSQGRLLEEEWRSEQYRRGTLMTQAWPSAKRTFMLAHHGFYFVTRYRSADLPRLGYRFSYECNADQLRLAFRQAEGVWIDPNTMFAKRVDGVLGAAGSSLSEQLTLNGFSRRQVVEDRFELWTRAGPDAAP